MHTFKEEKLKCNTPNTCVSSALMPCLFIGPLVFCLVISVAQQKSMLLQQVTLKQLVQFRVNTLIYRMCNLNAMKVALDKRQVYNLVNMASCVFLFLSFKKYSHVLRPAFGPFSIKKVLLSKSQQSNLSICCLKHTVYQVIINHYTVVCFSLPPIFLSDLFIRFTNSKTKEPRGLFLDFKTFFLGYVRPSCLFFIYYIWLHIVLLESQTKQQCLMFTQMNIIYIEIFFNADKQYPHLSILMVCVLLLALNQFVQQFLCKTRL